MLHDAFFKHQTKPSLTPMGDLYYEGKEFEARVRARALTTCSSGGGGEVQGTLVGSASGSPAQAVWQVGDKARKLVMQHEQRPWNL